MPNARILFSASAAYRELFPFIGTTTSAGISPSTSSPSSLHLLLTGIHCLESVLLSASFLLIVLHLLARPPSPSPSGIQPPTIDPRFRLNRSVTSCTFDTSLFLNPQLYQRLPHSFRAGKKLVCLLHRHVRNDAAGQSTLSIVILPPSSSSNP